MSESKPKKRSQKAKLSDLDKSRIVAETVRQLTQDQAKKDIVDQTAHKLSQDPVFKRDAILGIIKFALAAITLANFTILAVVYTLIQKQTDFHFRKADEQLSNTVSTVLVQMTNRISAEFETARIKETVNLVAEGQAKSLLTQRVQPMIDGFRSEMDSKLNSSSEIVSQLTNTMHFARTLLSAQNDDRLAFNQLQKLSENDKHPYHLESVAAVMNIIDIHNEQDSRAAGFVRYAAVEDVAKDGKMSLEKLRDVFLKQPNPRLRISVIQHVAERSDLTKHDRLEFLLFAMEKEINLSSLSYAGLKFRELSGANYNTLWTKGFQDWWKANKASLEKQPK